MQHREVRDTLLAAINKAVEEGQWEGSVFYQNILKKLLTLRDYVTNKLGGEIIDNASNEVATVGNVVSKAGYEKIYISLYQADSEHMERWLGTVKSLLGKHVSRPVYRLPEYVQEVMRIKRCRTYAYATFWVKQEDILKPLPGISPKDSFGHELITLKPGSIQLENMIEFVHDDKCYQLVDNQLAAQKNG